MDTLESRGCIEHRKVGSVPRTTNTGYTQPALFSQMTKKYNKENMKGESKTVDLGTLNFARLANNFLNKTRDGEFSVDDVNSHINFVNNIVSDQNQDLPVYNVGVVMVCINHPYWQYAYPVIEGVRQFFLPGHKVEIMMWSDMPNYPESKDVTYGTTVFPTESVGWPYPTLMRYHMFLEQEEYLKKFDYVFYIDLDMRVVGIVGDEILGDGITAAQHPMYALDRKFIPPYEPSPESASFIPRPGRTVTENGKARFEPLYFAGGFQGGKTEAFIEAMKGTRDIIDQDLNRNYIPIWNDESAWNRYMFDHPPSVVLNPSYVYPDSLIQEYYTKVWGRDYTPKIITITKPFTLSKEGGQAVAEGLQKL